MAAIKGKLEFDSWCERCGLTPQARRVAHELWIMHQRHIEIAYEIGDAAAAKELQDRWATMMTKMEGVYGTQKQD